LGSHEKIAHAGFHHIQAIQNLRAVLGVRDVCFRLAKQRAAIFSPFWPSHDISSPGNCDSSVELADRYDIFSVFWRGEMCANKYFSDRFVRRRSFRSSTPRCAVTHHFAVPKVRSKCACKASQMALGSLRASGFSSPLRIRTSTSVSRNSTLIHRSPFRRRSRWARIRRAAAERAIGGVVAPALISACSDMYTHPVPSLLCAVNLSDSLWG